MDIHKLVIPTPYPVGDVHTYVVKGDALSLFDAGIHTPEALEAMTFGLKQLGYQFSDIEQIFYTHQHPDHIGLSDYFPQARILAHPFVEQWTVHTNQFVDYYTNFFHHVLSPMGLSHKMIDALISMQIDMDRVSRRPIDVFLNDGDILPGHPNLKAVYTPGHSQCHLLFVDEQKKQAISGDLLFQNTTAVPIIEPPIDCSLERPLAMVQYVESLQKLQHLELNTLFTGHGEQIDDVQTVLQTHLQKHKKHRDKLLSLLETPKTAFTLVREIAPNASPEMLGVLFYETLGKLDLLVAKGSVHIHEKDGIYMYENNKLDCQRSLE